MLEIRFLGRGGQGGVIAAELLAEAAFLDGKFPQSFPFFGVERRGAPVTAYARVDDRPVRIRTSITEPDVVVVLDKGLLFSTAATEGLKEGGALLVNAPRDLASVPAPPGARVAIVDANRIALDLGLGTPSMPIGNTAVLGALARWTGVVSIASLDRAIADHAPAHPEENRRACARGFAELVPVPPERLRPVPATPRPAEPPLPEGPIARRPSSVLRTASWRTLRPEIHLEKCTRCNFCWKFCPDEAISLNEEGYPVLEADHCKGCGICAEVCPPKTIAMVLEA